MRARFTTAIFPIAGSGTRFLPATKSVPKRFLTVVDKPLNQYAMEEARAAGTRKVIFVTAKGKSALKDYYDVNPGLEAHLRKAGKRELLAALKQTNVDHGHLVYIRQNRPLGLGYAVWCARMFAPNQTSGYSKLDFDAVRSIGRVRRPRGIVEKPPRGTAPTNHSVISRYILTPAIMRHLHAKAVGARSEVLLSETLANKILQNPGAVTGNCIDGVRYDCGSKAAMLQATVAAALSRPDLCDKFLTFLAKNPLASPQKTSVAIGA